ncbi:MAG TPA: radical SAM/SPASM domain-containing protein [Thermoanaerobaculia bacterium]|nr:radical SAM/SPASM domain-containing protein [Thermoanaerobaculia bacterium]
MSELGWKYLTAEDKATILRGVRDGVAYGGPYHVEIYPSDRCNIDCFFCSTASIRGDDELPLARIEQLVGEMQHAGTRSIRFAGGGEPLFHRKTKDMLRMIGKSGIPIENITTNAVLLGQEMTDILLDGRCDEIIVSLNTADPDSYASMMQTPARNFDRVLTNVRHIVAERNRRKMRDPQIVLQYLVWKENYKSIPRMYELARELHVDSILFNGLAFLRPDQEMTAEETAEMMRLYEQVVRVDEFRRIAQIDSFEQDLRPAVGEMASRLDAERRARGKVRRIAHLVGRRDLTWREKIEHQLRIRRNRHVDRESAGLEQPCVIGWHSLVVRTGGPVAPCCILQGSPLGDIFKNSLREVWYGEEYARFRRELKRIVDAGESWKPDAANDRTVVAMCGGKGKDVCPVKSFYYRSDLPFWRSLQPSR